MAQAFASPWHLGRALVLTLPSAALAALAAYGVGALGLVSVGTMAQPHIGRALTLAAAAIISLALLGWGPRGREARTGAHLVAAGVAPDRFWSIAWAAAGVVIAIALFGISFAGIDQVWWPIGQNGPN